MALPPVSTRKQRVGVMGDMGDLEQVAIIKKVAANKAREDEMEILEHMLKNDPKCIRQAARLRTEYEAAANSPKTSETRKIDAQKKARRLRVAIKRVTVDDQHLPPRGPPLIPEDALPVKAHTPHRRRADETIQALHKHRAYQDRRFVDSKTEEQYLFSESTFNQALAEDEAKRQLEKQGPTATAQNQAGTAESLPNQTDNSPAEPSAGQGEDSAAREPVSRVDLTREQTARGYHDRRVKETIAADEAQTFRLRKAEQTQMLVDKAQSIVDSQRAEREVRRAQRRAQRARKDAERARKDAERARNEAPRAEVVEPQPTRAIERPWQPAAQTQRQDSHRRAPTIDEIEEAPSEAHQTDPDLYNRQVRGPGRRSSLVLRMGQAAAKNWRQGQYKEQVRAMSTGEARNEPRQPEARQPEARQPEPPPPLRRQVPKPRLAAIGKIPGAVANRWRQNGYPPELKAAEKAQRDALRAERLAEAQARGEAPRPSAVKRIGGAMLALRRGRPQASAGAPPPGGGGITQASGGAPQPPGGAPQAPGGVSQPPVGGSWAPSGTSGQSQPRVPAPTSPSRRSVPGSTIGVGSDAELRGYGHSLEGSRSGGPREGLRPSFSDARPSNVGSARSKDDGGLTAQGRLLPPIRARPEKKESISPSSSAPSFSTLAQAQEGTGRRSASRSRTAAQPEGLTDRRSGGSPPRTLAQPQQGTGRRSGESAPRVIGQPREGTSQGSGGSSSRSASQPREGTGRGSGGSSSRSASQPREGTGRGSGGSSSRSASQPREGTGRGSGGSSSRSASQTREGTGRGSGGSSSRSTSQPREGTGRDSNGSPPRAVNPPPEDTSRRSGGSRHRSAARERSPRSRAALQEGPFAPAFTPPGGTPRPEAPTPGDTLRSRFAPQSGPFAGGSPPQICPLQPPSDAEAYQAAYSSMRRSPLSEPKLARDRTPRLEQPPWDDSPPRPTRPERPPPRDDSPPNPPSRLAVPGGGGGGGGGNGGGGGLGSIPPPTCCPLQPPSDEVAYGREYFNLRRSPRVNTLAAEESSPSRSPRVTALAGEQSSPARSPRVNALAWEEGSPSRSPRVNALAWEEGSPSRSPRLLAQAWEQQGSPSRSEPRPAPIPLAPGSPTVSERLGHFRGVDQSPDKLRP